MTDEAKALVERLRSFRLDDSDDYDAHVEAADLIETQAREVERLRERLEIDPTHSMDGIYARDETIRGLDAQLAKWKALAETLAGALELADCALSGANMNMKVVYRKVAAALLQYKEARDAS